LYSNGGGRPSIRFGKRSPDKSNTEGGGHDQIFQKQDQRGAPKSRLGPQPRPRKEERKNPTPSPKKRGGPQNNLGVPPHKSTGGMIRTPLTKRGTGQSPQEQKLKYTRCKPWVPNTEKHPARKYYHSYGTGSKDFPAGSEKNTNPKRKTEKPLGTADKQTE